MPSVPSREALTLPPIEPSGQPETLVMPESPEAVEPPQVPEAPGLVETPVLEDPSVEKVPLPPAELPTPDETTAETAPAVPSELPPSPEQRPEEDLVVSQEAPAPVSSPLASPEPETSPGVSAVVEPDLPVASVIAQPDIPQAFRPPGVPVPRPRAPAPKESYKEDPVLLASMPKPLEQKERWKPPKLLPDPEPEPGVVYVVPFASIMVPREVEARLFDQFFEDLSQRGEALELRFVILKEGLETVAPQWLYERKYVTGEIYAYVEDSSCCATDLRTKVRMVYHKAHQEEPAFAFEYPVQHFFDHDQSTIEVERGKMADDIAKTLADELLKTLTP